LSRAENSGISSRGKRFIRSSSRCGANRRRTRARFLYAMSDNQQPHPDKKVTAATTDAPQEEFISQENIPSKPETRSTERRQDQSDSEETRRER
jgi:hypothetical protein